MTFSCTKFALIVVIALISFKWTTEAKEYDKIDEHTYKERGGRVFSLFSIVQFKNTGCRSTSTISSGGSGSLYRNGTCFTTNECQSKSGLASGSCAAGFGVCCVFLASASGDIVNQNCTYLQNPGYPSAYGGTSSVSYTVNKCSPDICWLRLDFESFTIQGTGATTEDTGGKCIDSFTVTTNTGQQIPVICGQNTGQHMYIDIGAQASDTATISFAFSGTSSSRAWEIKVSQLPCSASYAPRDGCLQHHTGLTGRLTTFNFIPTSDNHLMDQDYSICIRQEAGFCCVQYQVCSDPNSFTLQSPTDPTMLKAFQDTLCTLDYIDIAASSAACAQGSQNANPLTNKYCGQYLSVLNEGMANIAICDCTAPFAVDVYTDNLPDSGVANDPTMLNMAASRGVCLEWTQIPCSG